MLFASLDEITKRSLLDNGLPIHFYLEHLSHAAACIRELSFECGVVPVRTVELPVNSYFAVDLPDDFVDDIGIFIPAGQSMIPVPKKNSLTPLRIKDSSGNYTTHSQAAMADTITGLFVNPGWLWFWNVNSFGEPTGRMFGGNGGATLNGYKVVKERRQIQLTETFTSDYVILQYCSDGQSTDNAANVDVSAFATIQAYIGWKTSPNRNIKDAPEARTYYNEKRLLRARLNSLTITDIKQVLYNAYSATIKN